MQRERVAYHSLYQAPNIQNDDHWLSLPASSMPLFYMIIIVYRTCCYFHSDYGDIRVYPYQWLACRLLETTGESLHFHGPLGELYARKAGSFSLSVILHMSNRQNDTIAFTSLMSLVLSFQLTSVKRDANPTGGPSPYHN